MSVMSQWSHLTKSEATRVVGQLEKGQIQVKVAEVTGVSQSVISIIQNCFFKTGNASRQQWQGWRYLIIRNKNRYLLLNALETPKYECNSFSTIP